MVSVAAERPRTGVGRSHGTRADIQSLRAFAVGAVVLYHVWPLAFPGGYIGVDVFFVISGYLITGQLIRRASTGSINLSEFWAARARRLLPASLLVLLVSAVGTVLFAPGTVAAQYFRSIIGSSLYVENWFLAADAVDYLGADNSPPIAQHYWSLSLEEQFYVIWPLVIAATAWFAARRGGSLVRRSAATIAAVTLISLIACVWLTAVDPASAYFVTPVRMWQFGAGALVALVSTVIRSVWVRSVLWAGGYAALLLCIFAYGPSTPFPGYAAILPVAAVVGILLSGPTAPFTLARAQEWRPLQWVGDQSYGIYLWHWPLIVLLPSVLGREPELPENVAIVALTVTLAWLAKRFVEDPIRFGRAKSLRPRHVAMLAVIAMAVVVASAGVPWAVNARSAAAASEQAQSELVDPDACRGASVLLEPECRATWDRTTPSADVVPRLEGLYDDVAGAFNCYRQDESAVFEPCTIGSNASDARHLAITGDSHAAMLLPALSIAAESENWTIDVYIGRGCPWRADDAEKCLDRRTQLTADLIDGDYDAVLVAAWNQPDLTDSQRADSAEAFATTWGQAAKAGVSVIPVLDNPGVPEASATCLTKAPSFRLSTCAFSAAENLRPDPLEIAARQLGIGTIDLRAAFCTPAGECPMVAGGVVVYRDLHHISGTFSKSLAPYVSAELASALNR
ncbi:acyltransferase family protein [Microbacterium tenebrionis]|uniref:acyltransferase family protein n=1 Tax=Microbacterium tenebrionis TaxID=2830665 RepID=UPI001C37E0BF|nr:acyltransferase family protein [Microbacterium ihumii]